MEAFVSNHDPETVSLTHDSQSPEIFFLPRLEARCTKNCWVAVYFYHSRKNLSDSSVIHPFKISLNYGMLIEDLLSFNFSDGEPFSRLTGFSYSCHAIIMLASIKCH